MSNSMALKPSVYWGQDKNYVFLSVKVASCRNVTVKIEQEKVSFSGEGDAQDSKTLSYAFEIYPYLPVVVKESTWRVQDREVTIRLRKEFRDPWTRLTYGKDKQAWIRIDFDRFQYSDSSDSDEDGASGDQPLSDVDREMKEAELFWKHFMNPLTIYLILFNLFQTAGFSVVLGTVVYNVVKHGPEGKYRVFEGVSDRLIVVQLAAILEIFHAMLGWVRSRVLTTTMQVFGRNLVLFFILLPHSELHNLEITFWLFVAWSCIEVVRYPYYLLGVCQSEHWLLTYLRYTLWIPFYPLGFVCEGLLILKALPDIDREQKFSVSLPNSANMSFHFPTFLHIYLIVMMIGFYTLMMHMYKRRKAKIGPNPRTKAKGVWSLVSGVHSLVSALKKEN